MKSLKFFLCIFACLAFLSLESFAQATITGVVTDGKTGEKLVGATIRASMDGSSKVITGTNTRQDGAFKLNLVKPGKYTLTCTYIGYKNLSYPVEVKDKSESTMNFNMTADVMGLDEVVVTGVASRNAKAIADVSVARIDASDLTEDQNYNDLNQLVTGKIPGVQAQVSSGNVGGGTRFTVRGGGGLNGNGQPVIFIDGVRITNSEIGASGATAGIDVGGQGYSTLSDLNPEDIESIEILKGPAGAALYGTSGSNGVVLITTKKGKRSTDYYNVGVKYTTGWNEQHTPYSDDKVASADVANSIFQDGALEEMGLNIQGKKGTMSYYFGYTGREEAGILYPNNFNRNSFRGNFSVAASEELNVDVTANYVMTDGVRPINDNNITGWLGNVILLSPPFSFTDSTAISQINDNIDNTRFIGSVTLNYLPKWLDGLSSNLTLGIDNMDFNNEQVYPPNFAYSGVGISGQKTVYRRNQTNFNMNFDIGYDWQINDDIKMSTGIGSQMYMYNQRHFSIFVNDFSSPNLLNLNSGLTFGSADDWRREYREAGVFFRQDFNFKDYLFINGAVRQDYASVLGSESQSILYPKLSGALRIDKLVDLGPVNFLKLRSAWGQSGQLPGFLSADAIRWSSSNAGPGVGAVLSSIGNPNIKPESINEIEFGFEAEILNAYGVDFTFYMQSATNSIVPKQNAPSSGLTVNSVPTNVGEIQSWGFESMFYATPLRTQDYQIDLRLIVNMQENEIIDIGGDPIIAGFGLEYWREGDPRSSFIGQKLVGASFDADGNYIGPELTDEVEYLGNPMPQFTGSFNLDFRFLRDFHFTALFDYAAGVSVFNFTRRFQAVFGTSVEANEASARLAELTPGTAEYIAAANEVAKWNPNVLSNFVEEADWMKLRELSLRWNAARMLNDLMGRRVVGSLNLIASVRNVATFSGYSGIDPEVNTFGSRTQVSRGVDFLTLATPRTFNFTVNFTL